MLCELEDRLAFARTPAFRFRRFRATVASRSGSLWTLIKASARDVVIPHGFRRGPDLARGLRLRLQNRCQILAEEKLQLLFRQDAAYLFAVYLNGDLITDSARFHHCTSSDLLADLLNELVRSWRTRDVQDGKNRSRCRHKTARPARTLNDFICVASRLVRRCAAGEQKKGAR